MNPAAKPTRRPPLESDGVRAPPFARGAARVGTRDPPGDPYRERSRRGPRIPGRAILSPRSRRGVTRRPAAGGGRGHRLLRSLRGPGERREARRRERGGGARRAARRPLAPGGARRRLWRRDLEGLGAPGIGGPRGRDRWAIHSEQPEPRRDHDRRGTAVRVVIADDSVLFREGLARVLEDAGFEVVGSGADAAELIELVEAERPDVAIADIRMPPTHTDEGLQAALADRKSTRLNSS